MVELAALDTVPKNGSSAQAHDKPGLEADLEPKPKYEAPSYRAANKLEGKRALITGGDSGIGRAVAVLFAREGADVAINYLEEEQVDAEETKRAVEAEGRRCVLLPGDLTDAREVPRTCRSTTRTSSPERSRRRRDVIIADTGFWLALASRDDKHHDKAKAALDRVREPLVTTWPVMIETCHLMLSRLTGVAQIAFVQSWVDGGFRVFDVSESHGPRIVELMEQYAKRPMDLADASLVVLAEELGTDRFLSTDQRDFRTYRWKNHKPFKNLSLL